MKPNNDLTVILPIKDRTPYTFRWMSYADRISFPFKVKIADGGKDERVPAILTKPASFPNVKYEYIQYLYDQTYSHFYTKMADTLSRVDTAFVAIADDASFYLVEGVRRSVEFLRTHNDYSACGGNIGSFSVGPDDKKSQLNPAYGKEIEFFSNLYRFQQIMDDTASARVANHFALYCPTYYDVHRIEQLSSYFNILKKLDIKDIFLAELLTSFLTVCAGKIRKGSYLYMLRQIKNRGSSAGDHRKKWGDAFDRMLLESWSDDFAKFVNAIASAVSDNDGVPLDDARSQVKKGYRMHIAPQIIKLLSIQNTEAKQSIIVDWLKSSARKLKYNSMPRWFLHKLYSAIWPRGNDQPTRSIPIPIHRLSKYYEEIKPLQDFLTSQQPGDVSSRNG
jgi:glycosyltransferase domain-containing protein